MITDLNNIYWRYQHKRDQPNDKRDLEVAQAPAPLAAVAQGRAHDGAQQTASEANRVARRLHDVTLAFF